MSQHRKLPLHAVSLRLIALVCMLLDHLWATVVPGNFWMTVLGRLAFPIFAFQAVEGYYHTSNFKRYLLRLLIFGLLSEIPFNLMLGGYWIYPFHQNVMFTLLMGLMAVHAMEKARNGDAKQRMKSAVAVMLWIVVGAITFVDYGAYGVMMVLLFALCRFLPYGKVFQLAGMVAINGYLMEGMTVPVFGRQIPLQAFAILSLGIIWLYNGEKGPRNRIVQYGSYLFYPLHMLILGVIGYFL